MKRLYFDHNATCPLRPVAREALLAVLDGGPTGNPSSVHREGRAARRQLEDARDRLAEALDCRPAEIVFTSGGTEANALALASAAPDRPIFYSPIEHPSITAPLGQRPSAHRMEVGRTGHIDPGQPEGCPPGALLTVALANHEIGVVQDIAAIVAVARQAGALVHTDASQAVGRVPVCFRTLGVDLMTVSAHKLGGPVGIGALVVRDGVELSPVLRGGEQEAGRRAGTESAALACAFAAAAQQAVAEQAQQAPRWRAWCARLRDDVLALAGDAIVHSTDVGGLPNTLSMSFPGRSGSALVQRFDLEGVALSHGSACASGSMQPSPVLLAIGAGEDHARSALRWSVGAVNDDEDIALFPERLRRVLEDVAARTTARGAHASSSGG